MKKKILPLFVLFWVLGHIQFMAQLPKGQFSPQDFVKHLESFIVREARLTPAEATEVDYEAPMEEAEEAAPEQPAQPARKTCPQCGAPVSDDALFCNKCGAQL